MLAFSITDDYSVLVITSVTDRNLRVSRRAIKFLLYSSYETKSIEPLTTVEKRP